MESQGTFVEDACEAGERTGKERAALPWLQRASLEPQERCEESDFLIPPSLCELFTLTGGVGGIFIVMDIGFKNH